MFYIDQSSPGFAYARDEHYKNVRYVLKKKLLGKRFIEPHPAGISQRIDQVPGIAYSVATFLNNEANLRDVIVGTPDILDNIKSHFKTKKTIESVKLLMRYDSFIEKGDHSSFRFYNAYDLSGNLGHQTCVYCNRLYTHTIISGKNEPIARPTFDHWFPKAAFPLLALSFYNLIPSCSVCNSSIKGTNALSLDNQFHPYLMHKQAHRQMKIKFSFDLQDHVKAKSKIVTLNKFSEASISEMKLREMYSLHSEEIRELIHIKKAYSNSYLKSLSKLLKTPISSGEVYRLAFGTYQEDAFLNRRPLSKLKKDILTELGLIK